MHVLSKASRLATVLAVFFIAGCGGGGSSSTPATNTPATFSKDVLYSFATGSDGQNPAAGLIMDGSGNLYGTTYNGGTNGVGTVFKITPTGTESVLYSFGTGLDGQAPYAGLIMDVSGNLYGTTPSGGTNGVGTVFKINPAGTESVLYSFGTGSDGQNPNAGLIMDLSGNLYGTTYNGGTNGTTSYGTVFKITAAGAESVLHSFGTGSDGMAPAAGLFMDGSGNLYGTTVNGGTHGYGTVFTITAAGSESVLYSFGTASGDGQYPHAGLIMDGSGNLYGTTPSGGTIGVGTVFKITPTGTESLLHSFGTGSDGQAPSAGLIMDLSGNLYGTTSVGGTNGFGTVFKISAAGTESVLYSFATGLDGRNPVAGLIMDVSGNLYGTTELGGTNGVGTVFKIN